MTTTQTQVVVVGAGFTGLTIASALHRAGVSFVVLEARDRIGGKVEARLDGLARLVDTGGQFANDDMTAVAALAAAAGLTRVDAKHSGTSVTVPGPDDGDPWMEAEAHLATIDSNQLDDARTVEQWIGGLGVVPAVRDALRSMLDGSTCTDSRVLPISYLAQLVQRTPMRAEELQFAFEETMYALAVHLAAPLLDRLHLGCPVRSIRVHASDVEVVTDVATWRADEVVLALPPTAYASVEFEPALPSEVTSAAASFAAGTVLKYLVGYQHAFWLADGCNGIGQFLAPPGMYFADASRPDAPMLVGFVGGATAVEWSLLAEAERRLLLLDHAALAFGERALHPLSFLERLWAPDEWGGGGYSNVLAQHAPDAIATLAAGRGRLTFASTELAELFPGYIEGAICAGTTAAAKVLHRLATT